MRPFACVLFVVLVLHPAIAAGMECAAPLYEIDEQGKIVRGSKLVLREAALRGDSLRVGWRLTFGPGPRDFLQHWADASFVTVFEDDVFAQIPMIHRQAPRRGKSHVELSHPAEHWNASLGSDGLLVGKLSRAAKSDELRVAQLWCLAGDAAVRCQTPAWRPVYRHDSLARPLSGARQALIDAVRRGDPLRVTWLIARPSGGVAGREQSADSIAVSITGDKVSAEVVEHVAGTSPPSLGRVVLATDGTVATVLKDLATGRVQTRSERAGITWFAHAPDARCEARSPVASAADAP